MSKDLASTQNLSSDFSVIQELVMQGDLSKLNPCQRVAYYNKVCESIGLNPFTKPFEYIILNGKLTLYAKKDATEQLRKSHGISIEKLETQFIDDLYIVKASAKAKDGRTDEATGAVCIANLKGDAKCNAIMKAETKAKRRVTLSIAGLGWTDETEIETIPGAKKVEVDHETGEIRTKSISKEQANDLNMILDECDQKYRECVMGTLKSRYSCNSIEEINLEIYDRVKLAAIKNMEANHARQRQLNCIVDEAVVDEKPQIEQEKEMIAGVQ